MKLTKYRVTLDLAVDFEECGDPRSWDWTVLLDLHPMERLDKVTVKKTGEEEVVDETEFGD